MEGWTELRDGDGNAKEKFETDCDPYFAVEECRFDPCKEMIRSLFDQVLSAFLKEKSVSKCSRPIPALCGDGRQVDLFKLFWVVRKIGGYDKVSRNNLWGFVSEECGLGFEVIPSVKLIYIKYLKELDQWLPQVFSERTLEDMKNGVVKKLDLLSQELETRFRVVLSDRQDEQQKNNKYVERINERNNIDLDTSKTELHYLPIRGIRGQAEDKTDKDKKICFDNDNDFLLSINRIAEKITCEISGNKDKSVEDDGGRFHIGNDFTTSAKRVVKKAVNDVNGFCKGRIDADGGKSFVKDRDRIMPSAKKVIEKVVDRVHNNGERAVADEDSYHVQDNAGVLISAKRVVKKGISKAYDLPKNIVDVEQRFNTLKSIDVMVPDRNSVIGNVRDARKRKRKFESLAEMLIWLKHVAKQPDDPAIGLIPECSNWRDHGTDYFWVQALLIREALMIRRSDNANAHMHLLKNQNQNQHKKSKMHPLMYEEDILNQQSTERLRCSERIPSLAKPNLCPCCNSEATSPSRVISPQKAEMGKGLKAPVETVVTNVKEPATELNDDKSTDFTAKKRVSVGPCFQAEIPEWTGKCFESDSKWLGTRMWPPENVDKKSMVGLDPIGKGRRDSCSCPFQDSVECFRFHIAEKRFKLKHELGLLFFRWRFDRMGEEVSLSWTKEEEERFKDMMRSYAAFPNKFWINAYRFLPSKTRENLVSYYFNVFLVRRRSYQNRVTPKELDSDDDEKECGSIGDSFGYTALYIPGKRSLACTQNMVSTELV